MFEGSLSMGFDDQDLSAWIKCLATTEGGSLFYTTLWWIWRSRNSEVLDQKIIPKELLCRNIHLEMQILSSPPAMQVQYSLRLVRWSFLHKRCVKLNVDGSSQGNTWQAGFSGLLQDDNGRWIFGFRGLVGVANNLLPKLMALYISLKLTWECGYMQVDCESDFMRRKDSFTPMRRIMCTGQF